MTDEEKKFLLSLFRFDNKLSDNIKIKKLYSMSSNIEKYYKIVEIPKKNGKIRKVYSPSYYLKNIQKSILNDVLYNKLTSDYVTAYCKGKTIIDNSKKHCNKNIILKLDVKSFFDNISFSNVYKIYKSFGFSTRICGLLSYLTTYNDFLPQGAPTSAYLSNLIMKEFDEEIYKWCLERSINYTRYSDDMTFSMDIYNKDIIRFVRTQLYKLGLELNNEKICVINKSAQQKITGIVVNQKVQTDVSYRKKIRQEIYYINKYGLESHLSKLGVDNKNKYINSLKGRINFVLQIDKDNKEFIDYKKIVSNLK